MKAVKLPKGKTFEFKAGRAPSKYNWDAFFDGHLNVISVEDGDIPEGTNLAYIPSKLAFAGKRRYLNVKCSSRDHEGTKLPEGVFWVQSFKMTDEERAAEDIRRVEYKERWKAAQAAKKAGAVVEEDHDEEGAAEAAGE